MILSILREKGMVGRKKPTGPVWLPITCRDWDDVQSKGSLKKRGNLRGEESGVLP